ncbi:uncharacterized protein [Triticum aestivum]|uniref:uncharacterized protein n=1 Tax=Triticum aestivum TaxID=4565 RepID=UPI001D02446D|nr:uncharacterized protein LOC123139773 [Triticum aestivum]
MKGGRGRWPWLPRPACWGRASSPAATPRISEAVPPKAAWKQGREGVIDGGCGCFHRHPRSLCWGCDFSPAVTPRNSKDLRPASHNSDPSTQTLTGERERRGKLDRYRWRRPR